MAPVKMQVDTPDVTKEAGNGGSSSLSESNHGSDPALPPPASGCRRSARQAKPSSKKRLSDEECSYRRTRRCAYRNKAPKEEGVERPSEIVVALEAQTDEETSKRKTERASLRISRQSARNQANASSSSSAGSSASNSDLAEQAANNKEANGSPSLPASGSVPQECDPNVEEVIVVETDAAQVPPAQQVGENSNIKSENTIPPSDNTPKGAGSPKTAQASSPNQGDQKEPRKPSVDDKYAHLKLEDLIAEDQRIIMQEISGEEPVTPLPVWECIDDAFLLAPPPFALEPYIPPRRMHDVTCPLYCFCTPITFMEG